MSAPYVGEIRMFAGSFAPQGWEFCQGQLLSIEENEILFLLIGTTYGGDGATNFALPDLRGRVPVHVGAIAAPGRTQRVLAERGGVESVTLTQLEMPAHTHALTASGNAADAARDVSNGVPAIVAGTSVYGPVTTPGPMKANVIGAAGGNQAHDNMAPYLCVNFIISLFGVYPMPT